MRKLKHEVVPLDLAVLALLPEEDAMLGFHYLGKQAKDLAAKLTEQTGGVEVTSAEVQARLRVSKLNGLCIDRPPSGGHESKGGVRIWQRTKLGKQLVGERGVPTPGGPSDG